MGEVIQVIDVFNLAIAVSSLLLAIAAVYISSRISRRGMFLPFVIQELYEVYEYLQSRRLGDDVKADIPRLFNEIELVSTKHLILEQSGFSERLAELGAAKAAFGRSRDEADAAKQRDGSYTDAQGEALFSAAQAMDRALQALLMDIEPQLRKVMKDPMVDLA